MAGETVPPDVLEFFRALRDLADAALRRLEIASSGPPLRVVSEWSEPVTATTPPLEVVTPERLEQVTTWLRDNRAEIATVGMATVAGNVWHGIDIVSTLDGLISFAERIVALTYA